MDREEASFEKGGALELGNISQTLHNTVQNGPSDLRMGHLAATEFDREFHPVARGKEFMGLADLGLEVGIPNLGGAAEFLQVSGLLTLSGFLLLLLSLVLELAVVEVLADRGRRGGGNLYEV